MPPVRKPKAPPQHYKEKVQFGAHVIPSQWNPERAAYDQRFQQALRENFGGGDVELRPLKVPVHLATPYNPVHRPERRDMYLQMLRAGDRLPPIIVQRNADGQTFQILDGSHRWDAAVKHKQTKFLEGFEVVPKAKPAQKTSPQHALKQGNSRKPVKKNDEQPATMPVSQLLVSKQGLRQATWNVLDGHGSRSEGPLDVWKLQDGRHLLVDGHHRLVDHLRRGATSVPYKVVGEGYTDYYATPTEAFQHKPTKYGGLEAFADNKCLRRLGKDEPHAETSPDTFVGELHRDPDTGRFVVKDEVPANDPMEKREQPAHGEWVKHPKLPPRIQKAFDAIRTPGVLTPEMLKPEYRGHPHPLGGYCAVATNALYHMLDGARTGWSQMQMRHEGVSHWFLRHDKTGTVLDPTAEQFKTPVPYDQARRAFIQVGPPHYDPTKPNKWAAVAIERARQVMRRQPANEPMAKSDSKHDILDLDDVSKQYKAFHVGDKRIAPDADGTFTLTPRHPSNNAMGGEDRSQARICVGPSIHHCVAALNGDVTVDEVRGDNSYFNWLHGSPVFGLRNLPPHYIAPDKLAHLVPDAVQNGEGWLTQPTRMEFLGWLKPAMMPNGVSYDCSLTVLYRPRTRPANEPMAKGEHPIRQAAFRHRKTGQVVETGQVHDYGGMEDEFGDDLDNWDPGFTASADGRFLTREEAGKLVGLDRPQDPGLDSDDPESGVYTAEMYARGSVRMSDPRRGATGHKVWDRKTGQMVPLVPGPVKKSEEPMAKAQAFLKSPAFRHPDSGTVVESPGFHDLNHLRDHLRSIGTYGDDPPLEHWEPGFVDHSGKFYNRAEAAAAVTHADTNRLDPNAAQYHQAWGGLDSGYYREQQARGVYKSVMDPKRYTLRHKAGPAGIRVEAHDNQTKKMVGYADISHYGPKNLRTDFVEVSEKHQRHGIASAMYAHAEKVTGRTMRPSHCQEAGGMVLWEGNAKNPQFGAAARKVKKSEEPLEKALSQVRVGQQVAFNPETGATLHDYSHVLPIPARTEYRVMVRMEPKTKSVVAHVEHIPTKKTVGSAPAVWRIRDGVTSIAPSIEVDQKHRGRGLGVALYEALFAHSRNVVGATEVLGSHHSTGASQVHRKLSRKHGLAYKPKPNIGQWPYQDREAWSDPENVGPFDDRFAGYRYLLKSIDKVRA